jgi:hypothetical protein
LFNNTGEAAVINVTLPPGGMCMFEMRAKCGLPAFKPNNTDGLDIQYVQFDDTDGEPFEGEMPPPPPGTEPPPQGTQPPPPPGNQPLTPGSQPPPNNQQGGFRRPPRNGTIQGSPPQNNHTMPPPRNDSGYNQQQAQQRPPKAGRYDKNQGGAVKYDQTTQSDRPGGPRRN